MSTIAYSVAVALIGSSAAVASQIAVAPDAPVETRVEVVAVSDGAPAYDFGKFATEVVKPVPVETVTNIERLKPVRVAAVGQEQLRVIVRDQALAEKADSLAAAADTGSSISDETFDVISDDVVAPSAESSAIVPLPKARPSYASLQTKPVLTRKKTSKRKLRRPIRVAEAATTRQSRLAKRLRSSGWLIGAFR